VITDSRSIPANAELECDLCIVGAGAAGIVLARQSVQSKLGVIVLESGGENLEAEQQALNDGEVVDGVHPPAHLYRQRRLRGSTANWGGRCVPLDEQDFRKRRHVPLSGWPFDRSALEPFYERAQSLLEVGEFDYSASTALPGEFVDGFCDFDMLTETVERFSPPTNFWKRYRAELAKVGSGYRDQTRYLLAIKRRRSCDGPRMRRPGRHAFQGACEAELGQLRLLPANRGVQFGFERTNDRIYCRRRFTLRAEKQDALGILNAAIRLHHPNVVDPSHRHPVLSAMYLTKTVIIPEYARKFTVVEHEAMRSSKERFRTLARTRSQCDVWCAPAG
jgi:hypothetical protein